MRKKKNEANALLAIVIFIAIILTECMPYLFIIFAIIAAVVVPKRIRKKKEEEQEELEKQREIERKELEKQREIEQEENLFFDRNNCLSKIGKSEFLNFELTNKILMQQSSIKIENSDEKTKDAHAIFKKCFVSEKIEYNFYDIKVDCSHKKALTKYGIEYDVEPIVFHFLCKNEREIVFYVFPEIILAFAESEMRATFIGAYTLPLLTVKCEINVVEKSVVIYDKSRKIMTEYYDYNPIADAEILHCGWLIQNFDGSRSFRGGLLPEHNPLIFKLKFAKVKYFFGKLYTAINFSNYNSAKDFTDKYTNIISEINKNEIKGDLYE